MPQADQTVQNAIFPAVRADINDNLAALFSQSSGPSAPAVTVAYQPWIDTGSSPAIWKVRNSTNSDWITIGTIDATTFSTGGVTAIANGGTGETTASAAINALLPAQAGQSGKALTTNGTVASWDTLRVITLRTPVTNNNASSIDFTGIPSWVKRITVMLDQFSTNGTSAYLIRLGTSIGFFTAGYVSSASNITTSATGITGSTAGLILNASAAAAVTYTGSIVITQMDPAGIWTSTGILSRSDNLLHSTSAGSANLGGFFLDSIRITTVGGTNLFDGGIVNIMYEG